MAAALARGGRAGRSVLLFAVYRAEVTRAHAESLLVARLEAERTHINRVYFPYGGDADWPAQFVDQQPPANRVFFLYNLQKEFPALLDQLNYRRELLTISGVRAVFWVTEAELTQIAEFAPDFFRFRTEVLELLAVPPIEQRADLAQIAGYRDEDSSLSMNAVERHAYIALRERLLADLGGEESTAAARLDLLRRLGNAFEDLANYPQALTYYEQARALAHKIGDRAGEGRTLSNLGNAYANLGEARRAIGYDEQQLAITREIEDRRGEGNALGNLGIAYAELGEVRRAIGYIEQRLVIARAVGDRRGEGNALGNLGNAYMLLGEARRAIGYHEQALMVSKEIGDRRAEGQDLGNLGTAYAALGEVRRAIGYYEQRLVIARQIGDRRGEANANWNLGLAQRQQGDLAQAVALMQVLVDFEQEIGHSDAERHAATVEKLRQQLQTQAQAS